MQWIKAVAQFTEDLSSRGYSSYTLRDYRTDVLRLAASLDIGPGEVGAEHLEVIEGVLLDQGLGLNARRRRLSAFNRFIAFMKSAMSSPYVGPGILRAAMRSAPLDHLLVGLVYLGGLRLQEIAHLEGRDIRTRKGTITTRLSYRIVPLHPYLRDIVQGMRYQLPLASFRPVMPGINGFFVNARTLHGRFQRMVDRAGMSGVKPEMLRREVSRFLITQGTPRGLVKSFLGTDRGKPLAPRRGRMADLTCLRNRLEKLPI
jgi:integrase